MSIFLLKFLYKKGARYVIDALLMLLYAMFFLSAFIIVALKDILPMDVVRLLTRRDQIYADFTNYTLENYGLLYGNGFINNFVHISDITTSAHNQYLHIFFVLGIFGMLIFFAFFVKVLKNTLEAVEMKDYMPFKVFFALAILMVIDNYFILTVFPLSMLFLMVFLLKVYPAKSNLDCHKKDVANN
ncbi:MAG: hypothetical protein Q9N67_07035 [Ghiorsea sp.]|nr:hypothetical protein [Ghiorsea sp.]